jgi:hypothetical protein
MTEQQENYQLGPDEARNDHEYANETITKRKLAVFMDDRGVHRH